MSKCNLCKLGKTACNARLPMRGNGRVMFIQDCPESKEDYNGQFFATRLGKSFMNQLSDLGITSYCVTAMIHCPCEGDIPSDSLKECLEIVLDDIKAANPDIIVPMGNKALKFCVGKVGLTKVRGNAQEVELLDRKRIILPMLSPHMTAKKPMYAQYIEKDLETLKDLYENGMQSVSGVTYKSLETVEAVRDELSRMKHSKRIVFDIETTGINPFTDYAKVVCISLTDKTHYGVVIPLYKTDTPFSESELDTVVSMLKDLLEDETIPKSAHNGKFDIKWLRVQLGIKVANFDFDTMLAHYLAISEEQGTQGLKSQAWEFTDMGGYDNELDAFISTLSDGEGLASRHNYDRVPWDILKTYAAADVDCCLRLVEIYQPKINANPKWVTLMKDIMMPASYVLSSIEENGMKLDMNLSHHYDLVYQSEIDRITTDLYNYKEVTEIEEERKAKWQEREKVKKIPKKDRTEEEHLIMKENAKYKDYKFNWSSTNQLRELLFDRLGLVTSVQTAKGDMSTNETALEELKTQHTIPELLLELRKMNTLNNMFIKKLPLLRDSKDIVHSVFNLTGTITGRLSSENPNFQQLPRKAGDNPLLFQYHNEPKAMFVSRFGNNGAIMNADYCLAPDTQIMLSDYHPETIENICTKLQNGEKLYTWSMNPETQELVKSRILRGYRTRIDARTLVIQLSNGESIQCTPDHKFLLKTGKYISAKRLRPDMLLMNWIDTPIAVKAIVDGTISDVYNITVEHYHNYPLASGIISKNCALEMRIAAIISNDKKMTQAFLSGADIHKANASYIYKVPIEEVTKDMRTRAKSLGFGMMKS